MSDVLAASTTPHRDGAPVPLRVAALIVALEGAVLMALGVGEALALHGSRLVMGITTTAFFVAFGAGLWWCARGLWRRRSWARGPVVFAQLVFAGVAWSFRGGETGWVALAVAVAAAAVIVGVLHPRSVRALEPVD